MTDDRIRELFVYCIEAYNSGQEEIALTIYPARLTGDNYSGLIADYKKDKDKLSLWADLKKSYDQFIRTRVQPKVKFLPDGTHELK